MKRFGVGIFLLLVAPAFADFKLTGSVNLAAGNEGLFLNFGGPNFRFENGPWGGGLSFFPSLRHSGGQVSPTLGFGPFASYGLVVLSLPVYYLANDWTAALGLGIRL